MPKDIPWGYGYDRVTAMAVDPARLYVYWEVTDSAIAAARAGLGAGGRARLAERARLRHHRPPVRRHQRAQLLRPPRRAPRAAVVLRHRQADLHRVRRDRPPVGGRLLRQDRALGPRRVSAPRAGRRRRRRVAERARRDTSGRPLAGGAPGGGARGVGPGPAGGAAAAPGGGGNRARPAMARVAGLDARAPASRCRAASACSGAPGSGRKATGQQWTSDWAQDRVGRPGAAHASGSRARSRIRVDVPEGSIEVQDNGEVSVRSEGGRTHVMYGPVAGRDPRHRRARRAARARDLGVPAADRGRGRRRAR